MANWIQGAIKHPGALTKKAKAAGETTSEFAQEKSDSAGQLGRQARLALTLARIRKKSGTRHVGAVGMK